MSKKKPGRPRIGAKLKVPDDYGDRISIRIPHGNLDVVERMKAMAKKEGVTVGEIWIRAAKGLLNIP